MRFLKSLFGEKSAGLQKSNTAYPLSKSQPTPEAEGRSDCGSCTQTMYPNLDSLSGVEFENVCQLLLEKMGFTTRTTKASGDGGIDLIAYSSEPLFSGIYIIQCKRYTGSVGEPVIRDLYGVVTSERANKGILMTTGHFTRSAVAFAEGKPIELIDREKLLDLLDRYEMRYIVDDGDAVAELKRTAESIAYLLDRSENSQLTQDQLAEINEKRAERDAQRLALQADMINDSKIGEHFLCTLRNTEKQSGYEVGSEVLSHYTEHPDCIFQIVTDNTSLEVCETSGHHNKIFSGTIFYFIHAKDPQRVATIEDVIDRDTGIILNLSYGSNFENYSLDSSDGIEFAGNSEDRSIEIAASGEEVTLLFTNDDDYKTVYDFLFILKSTNNTR